MTHATRSAAAQALALFLALPFAPTLHAETHRLEDPFSQVVPASAQMQWRPFTRDGASGMETWVRVNVRVDTSAWVGRNGRVYMVLPADESAPVEAEWTTTGRLLAGRLVSGERSLVFTGTVPGPQLQDQFTVRLRSGSDWAGQQRRLSFHFEIDVD